MSIVTNNPALIEILKQIHQKAPPANIVQLQQQTEDCVIKYFTSLSFTQQQKHFLQGQLLNSKTPMEAFDVLESIDIFGWQEFVFMWGEAWKSTEGNSVTFADHQRNIFQVAQKVISGEVGFLNQRTADQKNLDNASLQQFLANVKSLTREQLAILNIALVFHDFGRIVTTGSTHPEIGSKLIEPLLVQIGFKPKVISLILGLTGRELRFGSLPWGESIPINIIKDLDQQGVDQVEFLKLMSLIYIFDVASVGTGKLTQQNLNNAQFLQSPTNIQKLSGKWATLRLVGFFTKTQNNILQTLDLTQPISVEIIPKDLINEVKQNPEFEKFLSRTSFLRIINIFSFMVKQNHPQSISCLLYILFKLTQVCLPRKVVWIHLSIDRQEFAQTLDNLLASFTLEQIKEATFKLKNNLLIVSQINGKSISINFPLAFPEVQTVIIEVEGIKLLL